MSVQITLLLIGLLSPFTLASCKKQESKSATLLSKITKL